MTGHTLSHSPEETLRIGRLFGGGLRRGDVVGLVGTLGSGKTLFVKGVCAFFGVDADVASPTFVIMHRYDGRDGEGHPLIIQHVDLYRIKREEELEEIGFQDLLGHDEITLVEWSDAFPDFMPRHTQTVLFEHGEGTNERSIMIEPARPGRV